MNNRAARVPFYIVVFFALTALSAYVAFRVLSSGMEVEVPDLVGKSLNEADSMLESRSLYLKVRAEENDPAMPKGHVLSQDIEAGTSVRGQTEIKVVLSKGPEVHLIPSFIGEDLAEAEKLFQEKGLKVSKVIYVHSDSVAEGRIIAQKPAPEEWTGETITLLVSQGPGNSVYYCPSFQGMLKDDALMLVRELGLKAKLEESMDSVRIVTGQSPEPGTEITAGSTVTLELKGDFY